MRRTNIILTACVLTLAVLCYLSISAPIRFGREQAQREKSVKHRLLQIRSAEERYRKATGLYTESFDTLVARGYMADSLRYIPYSDGQVFSLAVTVQIAKSGRTIPLMECAAPYNSYLNGLDATSVANLTEAANASGRYAGLKIGDIDTPTDNAGNWE